VCLFLCSPILSFFSSLFLLSPYSVNIPYSTNADYRRHQKQKNIYLSAVKYIVALVFFYFFFAVLSVLSFRSRNLTRRLSWTHGTIRLLLLNIVSSSSSSFFFWRMYPFVSPSIESDLAANVAQSNWYNMVIENVSYVRNLSWFHSTKLFIDHAIIEISRRILQVFYSIHCKYFSSSSFFLQLTDAKERKKKKQRERERERAKEKNGIDRLFDY